MTWGGTIVRVAAIVGLVGLGVIVWTVLFGGDERAIRARLQALAATANASTTDGLQAVARAAELGTYFTEDIVIELGPGTAPIAGRETLIGVAVRLRPRMADFKIEFEDVTVRKTGDDEAEVSLTVVRKGLTRDERSIDAREFALIMKRVAGRWEIARVASVDTLR